MAPIQTDKPVCLHPDINPVQPPDPGSGSRQDHCRAGVEAEQRLALVIGNSAYGKGDLRNPVNDARAMATRLRSLGFEVILGRDMTYRQMRRTIGRFGHQLKPGGVGLFYYAGHGIQAQGRNYLIPVDARIKDEYEVSADGIDVHYVLARMASAKTNLNIIILDACRDNPFERSFRSSGGQGLAHMAAPPGTIIAYATAPGKTADDGQGSHGVFTAAMLNQLGKPGLTVEKVFKQVGREVNSKTKGAQRPWLASDYYGEFYFARASESQTSSQSNHQPHPIQ